MKKILNILIEQKTLTQEQAQEVLESIANNKYNEIEITAFITMFMMRKISVNEIIGFRNALMSLAIKINLENKNCVDIVGTGGDEKNTFNISTISCFIAAGLGVNIAKHGNYAASSISGSSNIIEYFGYKFSNNPDKLKNEINKFGITFCHAPFFHPALKNVSNIRKNIKIRTFFNLLGPLVNPCEPEINIIGIYNLEIMRLYNYIFQNLNKKYTLLNSLDGYDEISLTSDAKIITNNKEKLYTINEMTNLKVTQESIYGGNSIESSAKIFLNILENNCTKEQKEVVIINTAFALMGANITDNLNEAKLMAAESINSKKALNIFKKLMNNQ